MDCSLHNHTNTGQSPFCVNMATLVGLHSLHTRLHWLVSILCKHGNTGWSVYTWQHWLASILYTHGNTGQSLFCSVTHSNSGSPFFTHIRQHWLVSILYTHGNTGQSLFCTVTHGNSGQSPFFTHTATLVSLFCTNMATLVSLLPVETQQHQLLSHLYKHSNID